MVVIVVNSATALVVRQVDLGASAHTTVLVAATAVFAVLGAVVSHRVPGWLLSTAFGTLMLAVAVFTATRALGAL